MLISTFDMIRWLKNSIGSISSPCDSLTSENLFSKGEWVVPALVLVKHLITFRVLISITENRTRFSQKSNTFLSQCMVTDPLEVKVFCSQWINIYTHKHTLSYKFKMFVNTLKPWLKKKNFGGWYNNVKLFNFLIRGYMELLFSIWRGSLTWRMTGFGICLLQENVPYFWRHSERLLDFLPLHCSSENHSIPNQVRDWMAARPGHQGSHRRCSWGQRSHSLSSADGHTGQSACLILGPVRLSPHTQALHWRALESQPERQGCFLTWEEWEYILLKQKHWALYHHSSFRKCFYVLERNQISIFIVLIIYKGLSLLRNDKTKSLPAMITTVTCFNCWVRKKWERALTWISGDFFKVWICHLLADPSEPPFLSYKMGITSHMVIVMITWEYA